MSPSDSGHNDASPFSDEIYAELRALASAWWSGRPRGGTMQPTALVHEAYLKLARTEPDRWVDEEHFRATAAKAMRQALVSYARSKSREKRGGDWARVTLSGLGSEPGAPVIDLLALEEALSKLERLNARHARVVELRYFAGLTESQIAEIVGYSERTVSADWRAARAWLLHELSTR